MAIVKELGYIGFEVSSIDQWRNFADDVLDIGSGEMIGGSCRLRVDASPARIILTHGPADDLAFLGWKMDSEQAMEAALTHLQKCGIDVIVSTDEDLELRDAQSMSYFLDPEGNRHEIYIPNGAAANRTALAEESSRFVTGDGGVGHVVLNTDQYPQMIDFTTNVLGLKLSDTIHFSPVPQVQVELSFFYANERHHSLAIAPRMPMGPRKNMHHFMLEVRDVPDVGRTRDRFLRAGLPVVMDIGQHPNDQMISFYGATPSGFLIEIGWGGVKIDEKSWEIKKYNHASVWGHRPYGAMP